MFNGLLLIVDGRVFARDTRTRTYASYRNYFQSERNWFSDRFKIQNAHWIAQQILQLGGKLRRVTMLRDEFDEMFEALDDSVDRGDASYPNDGWIGDRRRMT